MCLRTAVHLWSDLSGKTVWKALCATLICVVCLHWGPNVRCNDHQPQRDADRSKVEHISTEIKRTSAAAIFNADETSLVLLYQRGLIKNWMGNASILMVDFLITNNVSQAQLQNYFCWQKKTNDYMDKEIRMFFFFKLLSTGLSQVYRTVN